MHAYRWQTHTLPCQVPKRVLMVDAIPRNAMGKVNKKELLKNFAEQLREAKA